MGEKIIVGPINKGLNTSRTPFVIDNDSFPTLINAYQWRGRVKRKRGTAFLGRLTRFFNSIIPSYTSTASVALVAGGTNLVTAWNLETNAYFVPGSIVITDITASPNNVYTDDSNGTLIGVPSGTGTINYASGAVTITGGGTHSITVSFLYYPVLPVLGIEDFTPVPTQFPLTIAFDDIYSYNISTASPYPIHDVSFYKNPPSFGSYVQKTNSTPTTWNGEDYQQFWTTNYQGALWATNGIPIPFVPTNIGMQYQKASGAYSSATVVIFTMSGAGTNLVVGDFVFVNEFLASTAANAATLNFQSGYVTVVSGTTVTVTFPSAAIANDTYTGGFLQFLTNRSDVTKDCLRWYDGDPTNGNSTNPTLVPGDGWVNFAPPLFGSNSPNVSIGDLPLSQYYLVGCRMIIPFKDR